MKNIKTLAKKFLRETNGSLSYTALCDYIIHKGYLLIELHTKHGDELLHKYNCYNDCIGKNGISILHGNTRIVAINSELSISDKKYVLLHEIGHILIHFANEDDFENLSVIQIENEAEAFVYEVLRLQKYKLLYSKTCRRIAIITAICLLMVLAGISIIPSSDKTYPATKQLTLIPQAIPSPVPTVNPEILQIPPEITLSAQEYVYTLNKREVYHKATCYHLNINNARKLTISEAENIGLRPCKHCKPN